VRAVLVESFERTDRGNLAMIAILPLVLRHLLREGKAEGVAPVPSPRGDG